VEIIYQIAIGEMDIGSRNAIRFHAQISAKRVSFACKIREAESSQVVHESHQNTVLARLVNILADALVMPEPTERCAYLQTT
jgi:hypothetical protein